MTDLFDHARVMVSTLLVVPVLSLGLILWRAWRIRREDRRHEELIERLDRVDTRPRPSTWHTAA